MKENILFFSPTFYQYGNRISRGMTRLGNDVRHFEYCSTWYYKACSLFGMNTLCNLIKKYFFKKLIKIIKREGRSYNRVIVIRGSEMPDSFYAFLKHEFPKAKFVLYLWDDLQFDKGEFRVFSYFDKVYSYSLPDCNSFPEYRMRFRPMFFDDSIDWETTIKHNDLLFIASYKPSRFTFLKTILSNYPNLKTVAILRCSFFTFIKDISHLRFISSFRFFSIPYIKMIGLLQKSRACIELPHPGQSAITTRPVEALRARTKLITTLEAIKSYDFYNPNNILVINQDNPVIDIGWLNTPFEDISSDIISRYSLTSFISDLLV